MTAELRNARGGVGEMSKTFNAEICHLCGGLGRIHLDQHGWPVRGECEVCGTKPTHARVSEMREKLAKRNIGNQAERCEGEHGMPEAAYAKVWADHNRGVNGFNWGLTTLQAILAPMKPPADLCSPFYAGNAPEPSERDYFVAATVAQWLGTNAGRCFLREVAQEIEARKKATPIETRKNDGPSP